MGKLRGACGMADIVGREAPAEINADDWGKLMKTYNNDPSLIDPFTAGLAETAPADGMVGPLFACIIKRQFEKLRDGDRFFFSHRRSRLPSSPQAFSQGLQPIAKGNIQGRSLGAVICDNPTTGLQEAQAGEWNSGSFSDFRRSSFQARWIIQHSRERCCRRGLGRTFHSVYQLPVELFGQH